MTALTPSFHRGESRGPGRHDLAERLDAVLPQTQCTRCGYPGCLPYAEALAAGQADIDQCPPGGDATVAALARLLNVPIKPLNPRFGFESAPVVAVIDEARCIGCFKCVPACPVDAIVGARGQMHTVIAAECSGCALCLPPCPVDCIVLVPRPAHLPSPTAQAGLWRRRHQARATRHERQAKPRQRRIPALKEQAAAFDIAAAIARSRTRRQQGKDQG